ncbi:hypothetical protein SAMN03159341_11716 [Paenibacillus sp. 1_12]|nr:hypothetical protein SAMN03159341_11716 [Paenibacillus sp. 1_12]
MMPACDTPMLVKQSYFNALHASHCSARLQPVPKLGCLPNRLPSARPYCRSGYLNALLLHANNLLIVLQ